MKTKILALLTLLSTTAQAQLMVTISEATAGQRTLPIVLVDSSDHRTGKTGQTFSGGECQVSKAGAAFASCAGTVTERTDGLYWYEPTTGEIDTAGGLVVKFEKTGIDTAFALAQVRPPLESGDFASGAIAAAAISSGAANKIADHTLRRTSANVEASSDGDTLNWQSLYGATAKQTNTISVSGSNLNVYKADGSTLLKAQSLTTSSGAAPITGIGN